MANRGGELEASSARSYKLTKWGVEFSRDLTPAEFEELGRVLTRVSNSMPFAVGDWLLAGEAIWDDDGQWYRVAIAITGQSRSKLAEYVRVAVSYRHAERDLAPWAFYHVALGLAEEERLAALALAREHQWNLQTFAKYVRAQSPQEARRMPPRPLVTCPQCGCRFRLQQRVRV